MNWKGLNEVGSRVEKRAQPSKGQPLKSRSECVRCRKWPFGGGLTLEANCLERSSNCRLRSGSRPPLGLGFNEPFLVHARGIVRVCTKSKTPLLATNLCLAIDIGSLECPGV